MAPPIDVAAYQLSDKHPPDKGDTYSFPPEENLWLQCHQAILGEVESMQKALEALVERRKTTAKNEPLEAWVVDCLHTVWSGHRQYLEAHHEHEEVLVGEIAKKRFQWPKEISSTHDDLDNMFKAIHDLMVNLRSAMETQNGLEADQVLERLLEKWTGYQKELTLHIELEEATIVPLVRAYMSHNEMNMLIFKMMSNVPKNELGAIVHYTGEEHIRTVTMPYQRMPSFLWNWLLKPAVDAYRLTYVASAEAVRLGIPKHSEPMPVGLISRFFKGIMGYFSVPFSVLQKVLATLAASNPTKVLKSD
ncbi:expressed unknown protein [Seminavis robusta]|uniref:Hemerythrin-like domain-containing protein n=1 Tax=Seminavis robusta TaxID=568900 RepID=A0A9N8HMV2_9STRA|nr:expressed unknown protein [Seminavis robusta]|eukprot:Sro1152_g246920.1 n/a (305) ;mRNA; r:22637-23551